MIVETAQRAPLCPSRGFPGRRAHGSPVRADRPEPGRAGPHASPASRWSSPVSSVCPSAQLRCVSSLRFSTLRWAMGSRGPSRGPRFGPTLERGPGDRRLLAPSLAFRPPFPRESFQGHSLGGVTGCRVRCTDYPVKASTLFRVWRRAERDWACGRPDKPLGGGPPLMRTTACLSGVACLFLPRPLLALCGGWGGRPPGPRAHAKQGLRLPLPSRP